MFGAALTKQEALRYIRERSVSALMTVNKVDLVAIAREAGIMIDMSLRKDRMVEIMKKYAR